MRALRDHHDRRVPRLEALLDVAADFLDIERLLRDEDHVRAAGNSGVQRYPARIAAHYLDDQRTVVAFRSGMQPVDRLHRDVHRGVETERVVRRAQVVVDRLGNAYHLDAALPQLPGYAEGVFAADGDESVNPECREVLGNLLQAGLAIEGCLIR